MPVSNTERTLGILLAKIENIEKTLAKGDEHRAAVHRRVDEMVKEVGLIRTDLKTARDDLGDLAGTVDKVKQVTDDVTRWRQMGIGALAVTGIGAAALASLVTAYWSKILRALVG